MTSSGLLRDCSVHWSICQVCSSSLQTRCPGHTCKLLVAPSIIAAAESYHTAIQSLGITDTNVDLERPIALQLIHNSNVKAIVPGQSFGMLSQFKLSGCCLRSEHVPLQLMPCLTRVGFSRCTIETGWLDDTLNLATQIQDLKLKVCGLSGVPDSVCRLHNLQALNLSYNNFFTGLTMDLLHLTALTSLKLDDCSLDDVPLALEQMTTLQYFRTIGTADTMQILRPLLFFFACPHLKNVCIMKACTTGLDWNAYSMYCICQLQAAVDVVYAGREKLNLVQLA